MEIYNDVLKDLLSEEQCDLTIREDDFVSTIGHCN